MDTRSVYKVVQIPELFEVILLHLSPLDLLTCSQVNKCFRATMNASNPISRILFTAPEPVIDSHTEPRLNELLKRSHRDYSHDPFCTQYGQFNITRDPHIVVTSGTDDGIKECVVKVYLSADYRASSWLKNGSSAGVEHPSWKQMYLTQPPCDIWVSTSRNEKTRRFKAMTFGELLEKMVDEHYSRFERHR